MKAVQIVATAANTIEILEREVPDPGAGQVLVESITSVISPGTELAFIGHLPNTPGKYPYFPGYSACAKIIHCGDSVDGLSPGARIVAIMAHASHAVIDASRFRPISDTISNQAAAPFFLASIALQGVRKAEIQLGARVAVLGLGPVGNLAGQLARTAGAAEVTGIDPVDWRRELALKCNFDLTVEPNDADGDFDVVIEATGSPQVIPMAFQLAKKRGRVILLGSPRGETDGVNFYRDVHTKGLIIIGAHANFRSPAEDVGSYCSQETDDKTIIKLIECGRILTEPLISDTVSFKDAESAYKRLRERDEQLMVVAFDWSAVT